jgi:glycosyltransferase involved in cell wall biosynthesis
MHNLFDLKKFQGEIVREEIRRELGLPSIGLVIGHVGRFVHQKNHGFLLDVFCEVGKKMQSSHLLLVGEGPDKDEMRRRSAEMGILNRAIFAGVRDDVERLMRGAMDVFVFPSFFEGIGNVLIEAQAAGLPVVMSERVTDEAIVIPELVRKISLTESPCFWADAVLEMSERKAEDNGIFVDRLRGTEIDIKGPTIGRWLALYEQSKGRSQR